MEFDFSKVDMFRINQVVVLVRHDDTGNLEDNRRLLQEPPVSDSLGRRRHRVGSPVLRQGAHGNPSHQAAVEFGGKDPVEGEQPVRLEMNHDLEDGQRERRRRVDDAVSGAVPAPTIELRSLSREHAAFVFGFGEPPAPEDQE